MSAQKATYWLAIQMRFTWLHLKHTLILHQSRSTWKEGGEISTNPNMPPCCRPSTGVATKVSGLANQGRQNICCPIIGSGTSGCNEQQSSSRWTLTLPTWLHRLPFSYPKVYFFVFSIHSPAVFLHRSVTDINELLHLRSDTQGVVVCLYRFIYITWW